MFSYKKKTDDIEADEPEVEYIAGDNPNYEPTPRKIKIPGVERNVELPDLNMPAFIQATTVGFKQYLQPVLIVLLLIVFTIIVILAILVGVYSKQKSYPSLCVDPDCLRAVANIKEYMNTSINPCQNFYQYACGNFPNVHPREESQFEVSPWSLLQAQIDDKLKDVLEKAMRGGHFDHDPARSKVEVFFESCVDEYERTSDAAKNMVKNLHNLGSFYAIQSSQFPYRDSDWTDSDTQNIVLQRLHSDYGVGVFFRVDVKPDWRSMSITNPEDSYMIRLSGEELSLFDSDYLSVPDITKPDNSAAGKRITALTNYLTSIITLIWRDSNLKPVVDAHHIIANIVNDILTVEKAIAEVKINSQFDQVIHESISYLDDNYKDYGIDFWQLFLSIFPDAGLTRHTTVHVDGKHFMENLIKLQSNRTAISMRAWNNYIFYRMLTNYKSELGWDYIHANRLFSYEKYNGNVIFFGVYNWCLRQVKMDLGYALSALFIDTHFGQVSKQQTQFLYQSMMDELVSRAKNYNWMDSETRNLAISKVDAIRDKVGYPLWLLDNVQLDAYYESFSVQHFDHYGNMVSLRKFQNLKMQEKLQQGNVDPDDWPREAIFEAFVEYAGSRNEMFLPAGFLQPPFFDYLLPGFINFASIGHFLGYEMVKTIDYHYGAFYNDKGVFGDWYTDQSNKNFVSKVESCANDSLNANADIQYNATYRPMLKVGYSSIMDFVRNAGAMKISFQAYKTFANKYGSEAALPGLQDVNVNRDFFLIYGQTYCYNMDIDQIMQDANYGFLPNEVILNSMVYEMPEFQQTFGCSRKKTPCPGY